MYCVSCALVARTVHVPTAIAVAVMPETVQTDGVKEAKLMAPTPEPPDEVSAAEAPTVMAIGVAEPFSIVVSATCVNPLMKILNACVAAVPT